MSTFTAAQQQQLADLLDQHAAEGNTMRLDEVQGFVLALVSRPRPGGHGRVATGNSRRRSLV